MTQSASCSCNDRVKQLLQVNQRWKSEYGDLMAENQLLKATIANIKEQQQHHQQQQHQQQATSSTTSAANTNNLQHSQKIQCTVDEIENLKDQIKLYQEKYLREQKNKLQQENLTKKWEQKYQDMQRVNRDLKHRMESLEFKMTFLESQESRRAEKGFQKRMEQELHESTNKAKLMQAKVFPTKRHCGDLHSPKDIDERDSAPVQGERKHKTRTRNTPTEKHLPQ